MVWKKKVLESDRSTGKSSQSLCKCSINIMSVLRAKCFPQVKCDGSNVHDNHTEAGYIFL